MDWKKGVGFGVLFWVAMFIVVSIMIAFKLYTSGQPNVAVAIIAGLLAYVIAGYAKPKDKSEALKIGATWVVVGVILDALVTMKFSPTIFQMWTLWLGYGLVLIAPVLKVKR